MPEASIVHDGYGFRCTRLEMALPLALGLDGSAVLNHPGTLPEGWLAAALDQLFVAAPTLTGVTLPWAQWRDEPQAQALFDAVQCDYL
ncbi:acetyltransferase, partial [Cronobacter muytjensii]